MDKNISQYLYINNFIVLTKLSSKLYTQCATIVIKYDISLARKKTNLKFRVNVKDLRVYFKISIASYKGFSEK